MLSRFLSVVALCIASCLVCSVPAAVADVEPNDSLDMAELFTSSPFSSVGTLGTSNDHDNYKLYVGTAGTQIKASLRIPLDEGCPDRQGGQNFCIGVVDILDSSGNSLDGDRDDLRKGERDSVLAADATYSVPTIGTYFVQIRGGVIGDPSALVRDDYTVTVDANQPLLTYEPEGCVSARAELDSRRSDLASAVSANDVAGAKVTKLLSAGKRARALVAKRKKQLHRARRARSRRNARRKYNAAKKSARAVQTSLAKAKKAKDAAAALIPFQQDRVAQQESATRSACGGAL